MKSPRTLPFLLEIGCEEIPARFLVQAESELGLGLVAQLRNVDLGGRMDLPAAESMPYRVYSTPRRLVVHVQAIFERQPDKVEEFMGPPVKVALDQEGKPTRAAQAFAAKSGARVEDLYRVSTAKGEYLAAKKTVRGRPALEVLTEILPGVILGINLPKSMYWEPSKTRFVRPIRWILALLGEGKQAKVVSFEIAGVRSGHATYGHRALGKSTIRVSSFEDYSKKLRRAQVELDPAARRESVRKKWQALLQGSQLTAIADPELEDWVANSTEWPRAALGSFEERFLKLPREVLITVMRDHQKYFAIENEKGQLQPRFLAVLNVADDKKGLIRAGHERVLCARFTDAEFFWNADQKVPLDRRVQALAGVTYQAGLGSYAEKVRRMKVIAEDLSAKLVELSSSGKLQAEFRPVEKARTLRAVELSKCDLTTQMVQEFPELQGVVGGLYAKAQGESFEVADAIYDQYLPLRLDDLPPRTLIGAVVSLADKLDSVAAGFAVGHEPTGSSDPFALRRQGNGVIKVLLEHQLAIELKPLIEYTLNALNIKWQKPREEVLAAVYDFLGERLAYSLETERPGRTKLRYDTVRAVMAAGWDPALDALGRAEALEAVRASQDFEALSVAAKRIKNILAKSAKSSDWQPGAVEATLVEEGPEGGLFTAFALERDKAAELAGAGNYRGALEAIARLRPYVDRFFDKVLVMAEDASVRQNRLRLLGQLDQLFTGIAHFSEIAAGPGHEQRVGSRT